MLRLDAVELPVVIGLLSMVTGGIDLSMVAIADLAGLTAAEFFHPMAGGAPPGGSWSRCCPREKSVLFQKSDDLRCLSEPLHSRCRGFPRSGSYL